MLGARERALAREKALYEEILDALGAHIPALQECAGALAEIDVLANLAERSDALDYRAPVLADREGIRIEGGRHPVVERALDTPFVANDLSLSEEERMWLITGPNMGGKVNVHAPERAHRAARSYRLLRTCGAGLHRSH